MTLDTYTPNILLIAAKYAVLARDKYTWDAGCLRVVNNISVADDALCLCHNCEDTIFM